MRQPDWPDARLSVAESLPRRYRGGCRESAPVRGERRGSAPIRHMGAVCLRIGRLKCLLPEGVRRGRCAAGQLVAFMDAWLGGEVQRLFATWGRSL